MNVLVVGGTGFIGTNLCRELAERGHEVTALARNPDEAELPEGVAAVEGDVTDYESLISAVEGRDAVVNLVALSPLFKPDGGGEMHDEIHRRGTENLLRAAEGAGVRRFVQLSALGASPTGPTAYIRAKGRAEAAVRDSELDWVVFRPSVVFGEGGEFVRFTRMLAPPYLTPLPGGGKTRFQPIWVEDFVPILADAVERDEHVGNVYEIGGPEVLTLADVARKAHGAKGRPVHVVPVPMKLAALGLSLAGAIPAVPMGRDQYRSLKFDNTVDENDVGAFDVSESELKTLDEYLRERE